MLGGLVEFSFANRFEKTIRCLLAVLVQKIGYVQALMVRLYMCEDGAFAGSAAKVNEKDILRI